MHIALKGSTTPEDIWLAFEPTEFHESGLHFKAQEAFLLHDKSEVLVRSLLVERGFSKAFFLKISARHEGIQIGIESIGNPDRTDALKRWLGLVAWSILQSAPEMTVAQGGGLESFIHGPKEG
jgi:hypothetical protein